MYSTSKRMEPKREWGKERANIGGCRRKTKKQQVLQKEGKTYVLTGEGREPITVELSDNEHTLMEKANTGKMNQYELSDQLRKMVRDNKRYNKLKAIFEAVRVHKLYTGGTTIREVRVTAPSDPEKHIEIGDDAREVDDDSDDHPFGLERNDKRSKTLGSTSGNREVRTALKFLGSTGELWEKLQTQLNSSEVKVEELMSDFSKWAGDNNAHMGKSLSLAVAQSARDSIKLAVNITCDVLALFTGGTTYVMKKVMNYCDKAFDVGKAIIGRIGDSNKDLAAKIKELFGKLHDEITNVLKNSIKTSEQLALELTTNAGRHQHILESNEAWKVLSDPTVLKSIQERLKNIDTSKDEIGADAFKTLYGNLTGDQESTTTKRIGNISAVVAVLNDTAGIAAKIAKDLSGIKDLKALKEENMEAGTDLNNDVMEALDSIKGVINQMNDNAIGTAKRISELARHTEDSGSLKTTEIKKQNTIA
ncbi:hypothetical protein ACODM8_04770 [Vibrio ostreicida]|uniref:hypothetical protein n=1 Tax=Vibrio ostreicida TaxID=526588 RepID=UPI003B58B64F